MHLGLDVHRDSISVTTLHPDEDAPLIDKIFHDEASVRRLIGGSADVSRLRAATKPAPPATAWPDCSRPWGWAVR
jgi:hypothetical protein